MRILYVFHTYLIRVYTYTIRMKYDLNSYKVRLQTNFEPTSYKFNKGTIRWQLINIGIMQPFHSNSSLLSVAGIYGEVVFK